jgi:hypothetical protein
MVESGPAAGALAAAYFAEVLGLDRLLSFDMDGTTAKACIIEDRQPLVVGDFEVWHGGAGTSATRSSARSGGPLLPPALVCKYEPDSFWRDPARNPNNVTVI